jgi:hypothetical protein
MRPTDFCKWLNGFFEIAQPTSLNTNQTNIIKEKLDTVFEHYAEEVPEDMLSNVRKELDSMSNVDTLVQDIHLKLKGKLAAASTADTVKQTPKANFIHIETPLPSGPMHNHMPPVMRPLSLEDIKDKNKEYARRGSDMRVKC